MKRLWWILTGAVTIVAVSAASGSAAQLRLPSGEIAYLATKAKIFTIQADGTEPRELFSGSAMDTFNWSPDARSIAFTAGPWKGSVDTARIRIASADGELIRTLVPASLTSAMEPTWSPDGRRLAFTGHNHEARSLSIYVVNADGTGLRRLTRHTSLWDEQPDWSPDGQWIAFERYDASGDSSSLNVMAVRPDGTGLHRIARVITGSQCACADWSPDGSKIAYQASPSVETSTYPEIYVMNADGTQQTQLTFTGNRVRDENPDWSPDGRWIAFYSERAGNAEIYVIGVDGLKRVTNVKRITNDPAYVMYPRWRPVS
jgi:TolB protein